MYAEVVVLTYQSPDIQTFTYEIPKELEENIKPGQLVSIPFGNRNPHGIVIRLSQQPPLGVEPLIIKQIRLVAFPQALLLPYQIELLKWMSFYYHAPMVNCLKAVLPEIPKRSLAHPRSEIRATSGSHSGGEKSYQTLVLVPSINRLPETLAMYPHAKNYVIYHAEQKIAERFNNWLKIFSGNSDFIFGSRSAIFTPCPNLKKIIIYDEHDGAYKDERSPYYDTLTIAEKISALSGCKIEIIDSAPRITTYFAHESEIYSSSERSESRSYLKNIVNLKVSSRQVIDPERSRRARTITSVPTPKVKIVSMLDEKAAGNRLPISDLLAEYLRAAQKKQKSVLLFLNKKIESGHLYCRSCKHSEFAQKQPESCPNCHSQDIWFNSLNIKSLANLVRKIVPSAEANIILAHPQGVIQTSARLHPGGESGGKIDIATATIFYKLTPQKYDLVAHIATDTALNISDITSSEKVYSQILDLKRLTRGLLLLQTYNPDHLAIRTAAAGEFQKFYESQLSERKALTYPPFSLLVKLILRGKDEETIEKNAQKLFDVLNQSMVKGQMSIVVLLGPYKPFFSKAPHYNIILKIPVLDYSLESRQKALEKAKPYFQEIPKKWQIVIEPDSVN